MPEPNQNIEPIKVMLADDDKLSQDLFEEALSETNIPANLTTADNGQQLMDNLHDPDEPNPDIIFLDINMPVMDGKEALKEIKSDKDLKDIPTVMFSTSSSEKDINDSFHAGANLYVTKPLSFASLLTIIRKVLTLDWKYYLPKPIRELFFVSVK